MLRNGATFAAGEVGQAFSLDGVDDSIDIADALSLRPASLTLETWVFFDATNGIRQLFAKPLGPGTNDSYALWFDNGLLKAGVADATAFGPLLSVPFSPALGRWYHAAFTFDDASRQQALYLDGVQVTNGIGTKSIGYDTHPVLLGRDIENGSPNYFFRGRLDEAAIYNRALGAWEISSIYNAGPLGKRLPSASPRTVLRSSILGEVLSISFDAAIGQKYALQTANALGTTWTVVTSITAVSANVVFSVSITGSPQRFYRVLTTSGN
ncbi:MAG: hypothetical protein DME26_18655 [Verrucomicrobia bacterium]|nr:MAG: hypothetical protein DME26_18655 [Verrucomicrobiota bacterium]